MVTNYANLSRRKWRWIAACLGVAFGLAACDLKAAPESPKTSDAAVVVTEQRDQILAHYKSNKPAEEMAKVTEALEGAAKQDSEHLSPSPLKENAEAFSEELEKITRSLNAWAAQVQALREKKQLIGLEQAPTYPSVFTPKMMELVTSISQKPSSPSPGGTEKSAEGQQQQEQMRMLVTLAGAALCVYQPELCPFIMAMTAAMGTSPEEVKSDAELLRDVEGANRSGKFDDDLIERMAKKMNQITGGKVDAGVLRQLSKLPQYLEDGDPLNAPLDYALIKATAKGEETWKKIQHQFPQWISDFVQSIAEGKPEEAICQAFTQRDDRGRYYTDENEKKLAEIAVSWAAARVRAIGGPNDIKERYWDGMLGRIGLQTELNRRDPCESTQTPKPADTPK